MSQRKAKQNELKDLKNRKINERFIYDASLFLIPLVLLFGISFCIFIGYPISVGIGVSSIINIGVISYVTLLKPPVKDAN